MADVKELNINNTTYTIKDAVARSGLTAKQNTLVSGTNIKTINGQSVLGSGDLQTPYRNIGEIVVSTLPLTDAGLHLLDGSLILGYGIYSAFVEYIASIYDASASYFCTEAEWQTSVNTYGVCGKFVYDSINNTVRLPKITGILEGTTDVTALGDLVQAGLPIFKHRHKIFSYSETGDGNGGYTNFVTSNEGKGGSYMNTSRNYAGELMNISSSIYGNSSTVQPQTIKAFYYIVIATSTKTDIQVDIDEVVTDLNGKADTDLTNLNNDGKIAIAHNAMPSNKYIDITLGATGSTYVAPANGWFTIFKEAGNPGFRPYLAIVNTSAGYLSFETRPGENGSIAMRLSIPAKRGDVIRIDYDAIGITRTFRFIYAEGEV